MAKSTKPAAQAAAKPAPAPAPAAAAPAAETATTGHDNDTLHDDDLEDTGTAGKEKTGEENTGLVNHPAPIAAPAPAPAAAKKEVKATVSEELEEAAGEKKYRIRATENHQCHIGGNDYSFTKGQEYKVPESVATILANAQVVIRL